MIGDLVRTYHYRDRRWGHQWLYHVICDHPNGKYLEMVPATELAVKSNGGRCWLTEDVASQVEIVSSGAKFPANDYNARTRRKADAKGVVRELEPEEIDAANAACLQPDEMGDTQ